MEQIPLTLETPASISPEKNQHKPKPLTEKSIPSGLESQLPLDFSSQNFDSYTERQLSQEYEKRVGVPLRLARYDRQGVVWAIKNPREERDLLFAEDEASRKEDLKAPYSR